MGRRPVGVSWIGQEHLLVTSPSQVVLYSVSNSPSPPSATTDPNHHPILTKPLHPKHKNTKQIHDGGARLREWSFRPNKATAFATPALAASQQGLLLGVRGPQAGTLAAWPDKASLTAAGAAGPEGLRSVDVGFAVSRLVAPQGPAGVAWCLGSSSSGEGAEAGVVGCIRVACFATRAGGAVLAPLGASEGEGEEEGARILAALPSRRQPLLLAVGADGSVRAFVVAAGPAASGAAEDGDGAPVASSSGAAATAPPPLRQSAVAGAAPPVAGAQLRSSGLMWASGREESAFHWTVWATTPAGGVHVRVARVSLSAAGSGAVPALTSAVLYGKVWAASSTEGAAGGGGGTGRKRPRRASVASANEAAGVGAVGGGVDVVGLEGEGALVVVDRARGLLQAWDAQHGVALGEAALPALGGEGGGETWVVGEGGVLACVGGEGEVAVWRVEARAGAGEGGLRRVLGKGAAATASSSAAAAADLGTVLVFRGGQWVEEEETEGGGSSKRKGKKGSTPAGEGDGGGDDDEAVGALLRLVAAAEAPAAAATEGGGGSSSNKLGKARGPLARVPVSARTALLVARRCLDEGDRPAAVPALLSTPARTAAAAAAGSSSSKRQKKANGSGPSPSTSGSGADSPLWRLLGALLDAGRLPLRERPRLMEELLEKGQSGPVGLGLGMVRRVLAGPGDVPERAVVRALQRALALMQQQGQEEGEGSGVAASLEMVALAVRRPCCPAFLRTALATELDGPGAALLLVLLKVLLERAVRGGGGARPGEEQCLTWLEALLDANFVSLVLEGAAAVSSSASASRGGAVKQALEGVRALAGEAAAACQALETVGGYVAQFRRAGHAMEVIPDYSVDRLAI